MAYTTIDNPAEHFQVVTWTGNGTDDRAINIDMQPDLVWWKHRTSASYWHYLVDSSRGKGNQIYANGNNAEGTHSGGHVKSYTSTGITLDDDQAINHPSTTYVGWMWKANGSSTTTNDASSTGVGSEDSVYQANTTAGFSIVTYTGTGAIDTFAHGLGKVPNMMIIKNRADDLNWVVYHSGLNLWTKDLIYFNLNNAQNDHDPTFNNTAPTSSVFTVGAYTPSNDSGDNHIAYCFADIQGYSKFGSYTGNGNADGVFVYTGFAPAWVIQKRTNSSTEAHWHIFDIKRNTKNPRNTRLEGNNAFGDSTGEGMDFVSNGFKLRSNDVRYNGSDDTYIYMAFAEHPFVSSEGVPCTAR